MVHKATMKHVVAANRAQLRDGLQFLEHLRENGGNLTYGTLWYSGDGNAQVAESFGRHMRHILDRYSNIIRTAEGWHMEENPLLDLTPRDRGSLVETELFAAAKGLQHAFNMLPILNGHSYGKPIRLLDDITGEPLLEETTLGAVLKDSVSHTTHHYGSMRREYLNMPRLKTKPLHPENFGLHPSTPYLVK